MKKYLISLCLGIILAPFGQSLLAAPIPYSGKVAINGANFQGAAPFTFALRDADGTVHWRNGADTDSSVTLNVDRGLYVCLLGGNEMNDFPPNLFLQNSPLFLVVHFFRPDTGKWLHLQPDQLITSAPHALAAEVARNALSADAVKPGAITKSMLASDILADLNATVVLPEQNATIQTGSITRSMLAPSVLSDLNATIAPGSITAGQLAPALLADLNQSVVITRNMLPASVLSDLNRTFTISPGTVTETMLAAGTVTPNKLSSDVTAALKPVILRQPQNVSAIGGFSATFVIQATGGNLTYQWLQQGYAIAGANGNVLTITDLNATLHDGNYSVTVTNAFGSITSAVATLEVDDTLMQGLVGWWKFDETNGTVAHDSSGNDRNGTLVNFDSSTTQWVQGKIGGALSFDGVNDKIDVPVSVYPQGSEATVAFWAYGGNLLPKNNNLFWANSQAGVYALNIHHPWSDGIIYWDFGPGSSSSTSGYDRIEKVASASDYKGRWAHWVFSRNKNSGIMKIKLDGTLWHSGSGKTKPAATSISSFIIGKSWHGLLDDVRIYDRALSAAEIQALYDLGTAAPATTTTGGGSTIVADSGPVTTEKVADGAITTEKLAADAITLAKLASLASYLSPAIKTQPGGAIGYLGESVNFTVEGEGRNLSYQWKKDGVPIPGATAPTLSLTDLNATMAGSYLAAVSNDFGTVASSPVTLIVLDSYFTTDGLQLWLDADDVDGNGLADSVSDGVTISNWTDKSGNERNATQAVQSKRPIVKLGVMNGKAVMRFDGVDDHYADVFDVNTQNKTIFFVFSHDHPNTGNPKGPIYQNKNLSTSGFFPNYDGNQYLAWGSDWLYKTSTFSRNTTYVGTAVHETSSTKLYQDGLLNHETAQNSTPTDGKFQIAFRGSDNAYFRGDIAELLVFNRDLSDEEREQVEKYLGNKWGVDVGLDADLVGWWKFDETNGIIAHDSSGNDNNGTLTNGPTWAQGKIGGALSLDGVNDYVLLPATADLDLQTLTISAWVHSSNYNQQGFIFEKTANGLVNTQYSFFFHSSTELYFRTYKNGSYDDARPSSSGLSGWLLASATFDGSVKRVYLNGVQKVEKAWTGPITTGPAGISSIGAIHNYNGVTSYHFNGLIDDVRIYDRALTAAEVQALYQSGQ